MKLLAIDSSGMVASVAVVDEEKVLGEYTINNKKTHSQTLLPMIDEVVKMLELDLEEIDAIAISEGPEDNKLILDYFKEKTKQTAKMLTVI